MTRFWGWLGFLSNVIWIISATINPANTWFARSLGPNNHRWFLIGGLVALLISSFFAWNAKAQDLEAQHDAMRKFTHPQIILAFEPRDPYVHIEETVVPAITAEAAQPVPYRTSGNFVRVLATTPSRVNNCRARLSAIYRWDRTKWELTAFNTAKELCWSEIHERGDRTTTLLDKEDRYIDVAIILKPDNIVRVATFRGTPPSFQDAERIPNSAIQMFDQAPNEIYRFDVRAFGEPFADAEIKLAMQRGEQYDKVRTQLLRQESQYQPKLDANGFLE